MSKGTIFEKHLARLIDIFSAVIDIEDTSNNLFKYSYKLGEYPEITESEQVNILQTLEKKGVVTRERPLEPNPFVKGLRLQQGLPMRDGYMLIVNKQKLQTFKNTHSESFGGILESRTVIILESGKGLFKESNRDANYGLKGKRLSVVKALFKSVGAVDIEELTEQEPKTFKREIAQINKLLMSKLGLKDELIIYPESGSECKLNTEKFLTKMNGFE